MTTEEKLTIPMSERRPLKIVKADWPCIAMGEWHSGQHSFQSFDEAWIRVRQHADGRIVVYGEAGDGNGGGRPERENRSAGFLLGPQDDIVRAIRRVGGILAETAFVGDGAHIAERACIADLPAEEGTAMQTITMPLEGAKRLLALLDRTEAALEDQGEHAAIAEELRAAIAAKGG